MLDRKWLRNNFSKIKSRLEKRGENLSALKGFGDLDERRRKIITKVEELKAKRNEVSKQISLIKKEKKDGSQAISDMREVGKEIKQLDTELDDVEEKLDHIMLSISDVLHASVPVGGEEDDTVQLGHLVNIPYFDYDIQPH